jgi:phosphoesterase RecJ-like protein
MKEVAKSRNHSLEEIAHHIGKCNSFILLPHVFIDGDDMGSMLALSRALNKLGKTCEIICHDPIPGMFSFLPHIDQVHQEVPSGRFDCAVLMECTNLGRLPEGMDVRSFADTLINVDHHPGNGLYGDFNYVDCHAAAVGEIVYDMLRVLAIPLDHTLAMLIYVAILTDTGGFQFANTTSRTHEIISELLRFPLSVDEISRHIFRSLDLNMLKLRGEVFSGLREDAGGKIVYGTLTLEMMTRHAIEDGDTQHLIEDMNVIRDAEVVVLFKEALKRAVRVSMRSRSLPVNEVARKYRGGGHKLAAGCTLEGVTPEEAQAEILKTVKEFMGV